MKGFLFGSVFVLGAAFVLFTAPAVADTCSSPPYCVCDDGVCNHGCHPQRDPCPGYLACVTIPVCELGFATELSASTNTGSVTLEQFLAGVASVAPPGEGEASR
jgi:hypothetical protein